MRLALSDADAAFRDELREFFTTQIPAEIRERTRNEEYNYPDDAITTMRILNKAGLAVPNWPVEWGGKDWTPLQRQIWADEMRLAYVPEPLAFNASMVGPVIAQFGSQELKDRFLPATANLDIWWCQGFSEPEAGSDLASLRTTAVRDGDHYVINGQKTWTSHAHEASMIYMLVRTSKEARRQDGISLLLVPLDTPGITVRPIRSIDGWHHLNEVFFDEVRVRADNLIGEPGRGWTCAKFLLERERLPPANVARLELVRRQVTRIVDEAARAGAGQRDFSSLRYRLLLAEADVKGARELLGGATDALLHQRPLGVQPSVIKLLCSDVAQRLTLIALDAVGPTAAHRFLADTNMDDDSDSPGIWIQNYMFTRARTIAGGTSEVQRNVVATELLGTA